MVWIVTETIPRGTTLASARAKLAQDIVPVKSYPTSALETLPDDPKLVASSDIAAGTIVLNGSFGSSDALGPKSLDVPTGHLAVSVDLSDAQRVASFVKPGDWVAVYFWNGQSTQVLFPRVQVLGVGLTSEGGSAASQGDGINNNPNKVPDATITLSVTP